MKHPFRFWMTGSVAVVMAALGIGRSALASERHPLSQSSRFRVTETVQRIEACAGKHGLSVFTRVIRDEQQFGLGDEFTLIVFESSAGGTPVLLMDSQSICAPSGTPLIAVAAQVRVRGT